jgi:hypothetical protein
MLITGTSHRSHYSTWILNFMIFWIVTPHNFVDTYKLFSGICYLTNGDNRLLHNTNIRSPQHMVSHPTTVIFIFTHVRNQNLFTVFQILQGIMNIWWAMMKLLMCICGTVSLCDHTYVSVLCYTNPQTSCGKWQSVGMTFLYFRGLWVQFLVKPLPGTELLGNEECRSMMTCTSPRFEGHIMFYVPTF